MPRKLGAFPDSVAASFSIVAATVYLLFDQIADREIWRSASVSSARDRGAELEVASTALRESIVELRSQSVDPQETAQLSANRSRGELARDMREMLRCPAAPGEAEDLAYVPIMSAEQEVPPRAPTSVALPALSEQSYFDRLDSLGEASNGRGGRSAQRCQIGVVVDQGLLPLADLRTTELAAKPFSVHGTGPGSSGDQYTRIVRKPLHQGRRRRRGLDLLDRRRHRQLRQRAAVPHGHAAAAAARCRADRRAGQLLRLRLRRPEPTTKPRSPPTSKSPAARGRRSIGWSAIGIKGREIERDKRPQSNLVFLVDVSGSMDEPNKLPLLVEGMQHAHPRAGRERPRGDRRLRLAAKGWCSTSTRGDQQQTILAALDQLQAGGSTAGGAGIQLAYQIAEDNFIKGGTNRVILCTDGDFNVGVTSTAELERLAETEGQGHRRLPHRARLRPRQSQRRDDGGDRRQAATATTTTSTTAREARKVLVEEMTGTLVTIAKDVKIQVEFNPAQVAGYRLIGYENRVLADRGLQRRQERRRRNRRRPHGDRPLRNRPGRQTGRCARRSTSSSTSPRRT